MATQGSLSLIDLMVSVDVKQTSEEEDIRVIRVQELCENRGGRPGLLVPNSPCGLCVHEATLNLNKISELRNCRWPSWAPRL